MKANEFFIAYGISVVKDLINRGHNQTHVSNDARMMIDAEKYIQQCPWFADDVDKMVPLTELKRLVESHELVQEWKLPEDDENGLDGATLYLECYAFYSTDEEKSKLDRLAQAIADVESCQ